LALGRVSADVNHGRRKETAMKKILVAYDGSEAADRALQTTISLAKAFRVPVGVVSVVPVHPGRAPVDPGNGPAEHAEQLRRAERILHEAGIQPYLHRAAGDPARTIEEEADEGGYDTIVVGNRGLNAIERALQGSVSEHVAMHAQATVVVSR
jgi:nucleotide-binding universal stress UspA family protein